MAAAAQFEPAVDRAPRFSLPGSRPRFHYWLASLAVILLLATALRVAAARGELWLDEVWSIYLVEELVQSPADVIFRLRHENSHMLNSFVAYLVGPRGAPWEYRGPAVLAGIATVLLAGWAQGASGKAPAFVAVVLVGLSYVLVHYSSEARGYAYLMCVVVAAYGAVRRANETGHMRWEMLVSAASIVGFLAHPLYLNMFAAIQVWTWLPDGRPTDRAGLRHLGVAGLFRTLIPGVVCAWLYYMNWSRMEFGGGDIQPLFKVVVQTLSLTIGGPFAGFPSYAAAFAAMLVTCLALRQVSHESPRRCAFYVTAIFVAPAALVVAVPHDDLYPRYFLGSVVIAYLLWSEWFAAVYQRSARGQFVCVALLCAIVVTNLVQVGRLILLGRSHYREAVQFVEQETVGPQITLAADHGFRHRLMLDDTTARFPLAKPLVFDPRDPDAVAKAEWFFTHSLDPTAVAPPALRLNDVYDFHLVRSYPFAGLSGWQLNVYRRIAERDRSSP